MLNLGNYFLKNILNLGWYSILALCLQGLVSGWYEDWCKLPYGRRHLFWENKSDNHSKILALSLHRSSILIYICGWNPDNTDNTLDLFFQHIYWGASYCIIHFILSISVFVLSLQAVIDWWLRKRWKATLKNPV